MADAIGGAFSQSVIEERARKAEEERLKAIRE